MNGEMMGIEVKCRKINDFQICCISLLMNPQFHCL